MALSANNQALTAAFIFGLVLNAASGAAFLFVKANGRSILRDGPRLVLAVFLISSSLWAQVSFAAFLIENNSSLPCQIAIAFTSGFDQLARVALEQFLLASIHRRQKRSAAWIVVQLIIFLRFVLGCAFVGVQRPQFKPVCTSTTLILPLGIAVVAVDFIIGSILFGGAIVAGLRRDMKDDVAASSRAKGLLLTIAALLIWTATSVPLLLGIDFIDLIPRTVVPATGLMLVIGIVAVFQQTLAGPGKGLSVTSRGGTPDYGPTQGPLSRDLQSRNLDTANSYYPPNRYEELKTEAMASAPANMSVSRAGALPTINPPAPGQTFAGVGGLPIQGQLYPPMRDGQRSAANVAPEGGSRPARKFMPKGGKLAISNPILNESSNLNPLNRMNTIDLATAARNEKERRDMLPHPLASNLVPSRPAPRPGTAPSESSANFTRKEVQRASSSHLPRKPSGELIPELPSKLLSAGASSSAQLSPGAEELRRRSPRQSPREAKQTSPLMVSITSRMGEDQTSDIPTIVQAKASTSPKPAPFPPPRSPLRPTPAFTFPDRTAAAMPTTPKSQLKPESPVEFLVPMPEPLNINRQWEQEALNDDDANKRMAERQIQDRKTILARSNSAKANVRPSRQRPPSPPEGSNASAKTPGESKPTFGLPSNPRAMANGIAKLKSVPQEQTVMLFNEIEYKDPAAVQSINAEAAAAVAAAQNQPAPAQNMPSMVLNRPRPRTRQPSMDRPLFPAETSPRKANYHYRSLSAGSAKSKLSILNATAGDPSQLPPLPPLPLSAGEPTRPQPNKTKSMTFDEKMDMFYPASNAANEVPPLPPMRPPTVNPNVSKFSIDSSIMPNGGRGTWLARASAATRQEESKRQSSPVLPPDNLGSASVWSENNVRDDATTAWGSVHSPARAINIQRAKEIAVPPVPQLADVKMDLVGANMEAIQTPQREDDGDSEIVMVLLDPSMDHSTELEEQVTREESEVKTLTWHRRVGDDCPTFSRREYETNTRRVPPPTPLALNRPPKPIFVEAEPSPLESPEEALQAIDLQLRRLEETSDEAESVEADNRMTLLANLEMEMGQQENYWQQIKQNLNRDSLSTINSTAQSSPNRRSRTEMVRISIMSQLEDVLPNEQARQMLSVSQSQAQSQASLRSRSSSSRSSNGKQGSVEPHRRSSTRMSYLTVMPTQAQLGSPTPPDTDESESETEPMARPIIKMDIAPREPVTALWVPQQVEAYSMTVSETHLWAPTKSMDTPSKVFLSAPSLTSRAVVKKSLKPLQIESTQLWTASVSNTKSYNAAAGLWKTTAVQEVKEVKVEKPKAKETPLPKAPARPLTQKPPRRPKRMTMLPDILESPKPLPNKRDTLGIFQFPWGEKSDVPTVQFRPQTFMAIPGTMSSGASSGIPAGSRAPVESSRILSPQGYSNSFLDEYEKEDDFDSLSEYGEDSSSGDDDFDESTLWEIASLLQSKNVPSRASLFPEQENEGADTTPVQDDADFEAFTMMTARSSTVEPVSTPVEQGLQVNRGSVTGSLKHDSTVLGDQDYYMSDEEDVRDDVTEKSTAVFSPDMPLPAMAEEDEREEVPKEHTSVFSPGIPSPALIEEEILRNSTAVPSPGIPSPALVEEVDESEYEVEGEMATVEIAIDPSLKSASIPASESDYESEMDEVVADEPSTKQYINVFEPAEDEGVDEVQANEVAAEESLAGQDVTVVEPAIHEDVDEIKIDSIVTEESVSETRTASATMWSLQAVTTQQTFGLPQSEVEGWEILLGSLAQTTVRAKLRRAQPAIISSTRLWSPSSKDKTASSDLLWSNPKQKVDIVEPVKVAPSRAVSSMWEAPVVEEIEEDSTGLFNLARVKAEPVTTDPADIGAILEPSAPHVPRKNVFEWKSMPKISSWNMWSGKKETPASPQAPAEVPATTQTKAPVESPKAQYWLFSSRKRSDSAKSTDSIPVTPPAARDDTAKETEGVAEQDSGKILPWRNATPQEWDDALRAAIRAGRPGRVLAASEANWTAALEDAITAGMKIEELPLSPAVDVPVEIASHQDEPEIAAVEITSTPKFIQEVSLWSQPSPTLPLSSNVMWQPVPTKATSQDSLSELPIAQHIKLSRSARNEKVRSLYSTSFEFSSQALWNSTRALTQQQRNNEQKDWLREESAFGWY